MTDPDPQTPHGAGTTDDAPPVADPPRAVPRHGVFAWLRARLRWKLLLARWVVGTLAVMATVAAVPGLSIDGDWWLWSLVLGAVFAVLSAVVKPALQVLTIRYLFLSWGLVLLAVDVATLWLLEALVSPLDVANGLSLVLGGLLLAVLVPVLETLLGVSRPIVERATPSVHIGAP